MRLYLIPLLFCLPICLASAQEAATAQPTALPATEPAKVGMSAETLAKVPQALQKLVDDGKVAGAVVTVARKGKIVLNEAVGYADKEAKRPMETDSVVRIYSMTKPITSTSVMMLVEQGKLKLDDAVSKYIPELAKPQVYAGGEDDDAKFEPAKREVTVRDLLRHTSGYTYGFFGESYVDKQYRKALILAPFADLEATVAKIGKQPLLYQPGTHFNYSVSTDVLGRLIEVVSGQTLDQFFADNIFKPLKMNDSGFFVKEKNHERFVNNYSLDDDGKTLVVGDAATSSQYLKRPKLLSGGGGCVSTAGDYIRFCQMVLNKGELEGARLLKSETVESMWQNQLPESAPDVVMQGLKRKGVGFGLGFSLVYAETSASSPVPIGELGWGGAASTHFWLSPKDDLAVVVMTQRMPFTFQAEAVVKPIVYAAIED
ncbi:MAG: beta-lactamase family protein [Pirellulaceae bacterium]|nr:beta-lactamase family protein [Pirellulaceae bacterium]